MALAVPTAAATTAAVGLRPDVAAQFSDPTYAGVLTLLVTVAAASAWMALALRVPDDRRSGRVGLWPLAVAVAWGAWMIGVLAAAGPVSDQIVNEPSHAACFWQILATSLLPAVALMRFVRMAAPLDARRTGVLAAVAAGAVGATSAALVCPIDRAAHQFLWHFLPLAGLGAIGAVAGAIWLDRLRALGRR
jgi:hypothetical protein